MTSRCRLLGAHRDDVAAGERRELLQQEAGLLLQVRGARHHVHAGGRIRVHRVNRFLLFLVFLRMVQGPGMGLVLAVCSVAAAAAAKASHGKARRAAVAKRAAAAKLRPAKAAGRRQLLRRRDACRQVQNHPFEQRIIPSNKSTLGVHPCSCNDDWTAVCSELRMHK